jgi:Arc/MetJ family transcription regulator
VVWLRSDGAERTDAELVAAVRRELGFTRRSARVDAVVRTAVERALGRPLG